MTHNEAQALAADLTRAGVKVEEVRPRALLEFGLPGEWAIVVWHDQPAHHALITNATVFREAVRSGLIPQLAPGALDALP